MFCFQSFSVNILAVVKFGAFTWCEEWVIAVQTINHFVVIFQKHSETHISEKPYNPALRSLSSMPYNVCKMFIIRYRNIISRCSALNFHKRLR